MIFNDFQRFFQQRQQKIRCQVKHSLINFVSKATISLDAGEITFIIYCLFQVTFSTAPTSKDVSIHGRKAGESFVRFNTTSDVNISKYVFVLNTVLVIGENA